MKYICKCGKKYNNSQSFNAHKRSHTSYKHMGEKCCSLLTRKVVCVINLDKHEKIYKSKKIICIECKKIGYGKYKKKFCSQSCSAVHSNKNKKFGVRRSKIEKYIEKNLKKQYSHIKFLFNKKLNGSEMDIFIPELNLAFEINGIVHYKPIYGEEKFKRIKLNDKLKLKICKKNNIELKIVNVSKQVKFNEEKSKKYLNKIYKIINGRDTQQRSENFGFGDRRFAN